MLKTLDDILTIAKNKNNIELVQLPFPMAKVFSTTRQTMIRMAEVKSIDLQSETINTKLDIDIHLLKSKLSKEFSQEILVNDEHYEKFIVLGDQSRIGQICNNLTNNAIKFTPSGGKVTMKSTLVSSIENVTKIWDNLRSQYDGCYVYNEHLITENDKNKVCLTSSSARIQKYAKINNLKGNDKESISLILMM